MSQWLLEFEDIYYTYPGTIQPAIDLLTLRIPQGKCCAVIGQNGCGKTTLFLLANGLYKPQQGSIYYAGKQLKYNRNALINLWLLGWLHCDQNLAVIVFGVISLG